MEKESSIIRGHLSNRIMFHFFIKSTIWVFFNCKKNNIEICCIVLTWVALIICKLFLKPR